MNIWDADFYCNSSLAFHNNSSEQESSNRILESLVILSVKNRNIYDKHMNTALKQAVSTETECPVIKKHNLMLYIIYLLLQ